jgi:diguanylate cyclase (GGDEF)-like protein/PAS domain S-box-containing protein
MRVQKGERVQQRGHLSEKLAHSFPFLLVLVGILTVLVGTPAVGEDATAWLSEEERTWITEHPVITVAPDPDFPPIEYFDENGEYQGLAADYLALIEQKTGIEFRVVRCANWDEVLVKARAHEIDALPAAAQTPQRSEYLLFSDPHIVLKGVILVRQQVEGTLTLEELRGMRVAVVRGYVWQEFITRDHPEIKLDLMEDLPTGLRKVSLGIDDAMVATLPVAIYHIEKEGITNLRAAGETGYFTKLSFASRKDWPQLHTIVQGALARIPQSEKDAILSNWINLKTEENISAHTLWLIIGIIFVLAAIALWVIGWNVTLKRRVARKTEALRESEEKYRSLFGLLSDAVFLETLDGEILDVNKSACDLLGYTHEELTQMRVRDLLPEGAPGFLPKEIEEETLSDAPIETVNKHKDGTLIAVELRGRIVEIDHEPRLLVSLRDIRERVRVEKTRQVMQQIAEAVNTTESLDELFPVIHRILGTIIDTTNFRIALYDKERDTIFLPYMVDEKDAYHSFVGGRSLTACVIKENRPLLITPEKREALIRKEGLKPVGSTSKVWLGVPLRVEGEAIGAVVVQSYTDPAMYGKEEMEILKLVSEQIGVAIKRKRDQDELREREEQYRSIFEATTDAILIYDLDGEIVAANPSAYRMYGYDEGELIGLPAQEIVHPDYFHGFANFQAAIEEKGRFIARSVNLRKDGTPFDVEVHGSRFTYQGRPHLLSVVSDISKRVRWEEALRRKIKQLSALDRISQTLNASLELDQILSKIVSLAKETLGSDYTSVMLVDEVRHKVSSAEDLSGVPTIEYRIRKKGLATWIMDSGQAVIIDEIGEDGTISPILGEGAPRFANPSIVKAGIKSVAGLPLKSKGRILGVLFLHSLHPRTFHGQLRFLLTLANDVAAAVENARLYALAQQEITERVQAERALRQTKQKIEQLHEIARRLEACENEDEAYRATMGAAERILDFSLASLDIVEGEKLVVKATSSELPPDASRETALDDGGLAAKTYRTGKTTLFGNMNEVPEATPTREEFRSGISAPIGDIGVFQVVSPKENAFTEEDVRLLELLLGHTAEAIKKIRLQERLKAQAMRDPLTGVYNRRYFNQVIEQEIGRSKRYNHPIAFLMIDIDRFKEINDRFGHQMGDRVLQQVATLLQEQVRETDIVLRYGGDEFLIMLPETDGDTKTVKERIQAAIKERNRTNELVDFPVTLAIGSAHWEPNGDRSVDQVLAEADKHMYAEKQRKRGD